MNIADYRIVGYAEKTNNPDNYYLNILGYYDEYFHFIYLDREKRANLFPPNGRVFAVQFSKKHSDLNGKFVSFFTYESENESPRDRYMWDRDHVVEEFGYTVKSINEDDLLAKSIDNIWDTLRKYDLIGKDSYVKCDNVLYKFFLNKNPDNYIEYWNLDKDFHLNENSNYFTLENHSVVLNIQTKSKLLDICPDEALKSSFTSILQKKYPDILKILKDECDWANLERDTFSYLKLPKPIVASRVKRISELLEKISLLKVEIDSLKNDDKLGNLIKNTIKQNNQLYWAEFKKENQTVFQELVDKHNSQFNTFAEEKKKIINQLNQEIEILESKRTDAQSEIEQIISQKKIELKIIDKRYTEKQEKLDNLKLNHDRIIGDYSIIKEVMSASISTQKGSTQYYIEEIGHDIFTSIDTIEIQERFRYYLSQNYIKTDIAKRLYKLVGAYEVTLLPDISIANCIIRTIGKAKYLVCNVGVDWKNFDSLWNNGLCELWSSCFVNPDIMHILVLENMNMSYIPCYMQPINDLIIGIRSCLPSYSTNKGFPSCLRILGIPVEGNDVMPIHWNDIKLYGGLKKGNYDSEDEPINECPFGYLSSKHLKKLVDIGKGKSDVDSYLINSDE